MGIEREEKILQCLVLVKSAGKRNGVTVTSGLMCSQICRFIYSFILIKLNLVNLTHIVMLSPTHSQ